jgi:hypothetical protein
MNNNDTPNKTLTTGAISNPKTAAKFDTETG